MGSGEDDSEDVGVRRTQASSPASVLMVNTPLSPSQRPLRASLTVSVSILMRVVLQKPYRGLSSLIFDLLSALASTVSSCRSALGTRAQIRDLRIDSRGSLLWSASVTDNFGNRDYLRAGKRRSKRKSESSLILWGRRGTQAMPFVSVTEVIKVIGYQPWYGVLRKVNVASTAASSSCHS
jgi:hypothetical protein